MDDPRLPLENPANSGILRYLRTLSWARERVAGDPQLESCAPSAAKDPHERLGTHPDVVSRMWGSLGDSLPERCAWVLIGIPVLAHPHTGFVFAYSSGMQYALRLPPPALEAALRAGVKQVYRARGNPWTGAQPWTLDLALIGPDWCFGAYRGEEAGWCLDAFTAAARG